MMVGRQSGILVRILVDGVLIGVVAGEAHVRSGIPGEFQFQTIAVLVAGVLSSVAGGRIGIRDPADYVFIW